jgi:hypothetical protein
MAEQTVDKTLMEKVALFKKYYDKEKELKEKIEEIGIKKDNAEAALYEAMIFEGIQNIKTNTGLFYLLDKDYTSIKPGTQDEFFRYLEESDDGDLIKPTIHNQTLTSWVKERIGAGTLAEDEELAKYITIFTRHKVGVRKGTKNGN